MTQLLPLREVPSNSQTHDGLTMNANYRHDQGADMHETNGAQLPKEVQPTNEPAEMRYYDLVKNWRKVKRYLNDKHLNAILVRDFNRFTYGAWGKKFQEGMYPINFGSFCEWRMRHKGRPPGFWRYVSHSACHWLVNFALKLAMLVEPDKQWRIITSNKHSTVWDGDRTLFEFNFQAFGIRPQECFESARDLKLAPGAELQVGWPEHYVMEMMRKLSYASFESQRGLYVYETAVKCAAEMYSGVYPKHILCEFAWNCWINGKRSFKPDEKLTVDLLLPFIDMGILVITKGMYIEPDSVNIDRGTLYRDYEFRFRYSVMLGFLAACWAVKHAASVQVTIERLQDDRIWSLSPSQQRWMFPFLTQLVVKEEDLKGIVEFAAKEPIQRAVLLKVAQKAAKAAKKHREDQERWRQRSQVVTRVQEQVVA